MVAVAAYKLGTTCPPDRAAMILEDLATEGWTEQELAEACHRIATDPEIAKEVSYAGTLAPYIFTLARPKKRGRYCPRCGEAMLEWITEARICRDCYGLNSNVEG